MSFDGLRGDDRLAPSLPVSDLVSLIRERAQRDPKRELLYFLGDDEQVTAALTAPMLERRARAIAVELQARGLSGQRAILLFPPGLEYVEAFYGCLFAGVLAVPAYPPNPVRLRQSLPRLVSIVENSQPAILLTTAAALPLVEGLSSFHEVFSGLQILATDTLPDEAGDEWQAPAVSAEDIAFIQYTSGSTSEPKGVLVTHGNILHTAEDLARCVAYREWERLLIWLPTFHDMGLICGLVMPLYKGLPMYLMSPLTFLQRPLRWWQAISTYGVTQTVGPNFSYDLSVRKSTPEQRAALRLGQLRITGTVAEPIHRATVESFSEAFAVSGFQREAFLSGYGLAESTLKVTGGLVRWVEVSSQALKQNRVEISSQETHETQSVISCGTTDMGTELCIVNPETLCRCEADEVGEIWVRGPGIARGYWNRPEETARVFSAYLNDTGEGPFLRTGDLGFVLDGELFVTGRLKDLIILDGVNIYPQDIEWTMQAAHRGIRPGCCAVFSIEREGREHVVAVAEVAKSIGTDGPAKEIASTVKRAVSESHQIALEDLVFLQPGTIPKTSSGKIQRHAARNGYVSGTLEVSDS